MEKYSSNIYLGITQLLLINIGLTLALGAVLGESFGSFGSSIHIVGVAKRN